MMEWKEGMEDNSEFMVEDTGWIMLPLTELELKGRSSSRGRVGDGEKDKDKLIEKKALCY